MSCLEFILHLLMAYFVSFEYFLEDKNSERNMREKGTKNSWYYYEIYADVLYFVRKDLCILDDGTNEVIISLYIYIIIFCSKLPIAQPCTLKKCANTINKITCVSMYTSNNFIYKITLFVYHDRIILFVQVHKIIPRLVWYNSLVLHL